MSTYTVERKYDTAIAEIDQLLKVLDGPASQILDPEAVQTRRRELEAQRDQLQRRTQQQESSIEFQRVSPDGSVVVWCDRENNLTVWKPTASGEFPADPDQSLQLPANVSRHRSAVAGGSVDGAGHGRSDSACLELRHRRTSNAGT
ncbi:MAG: hypothetical protein R3C19_10890 [Planctomycetaceae bacterium]